MNRKMIVSNLIARPVRTSVGVLAVALEVTLILVVVGLVTGMTTETASRIQGIGADIMFQPPNSSTFLALSNTAMPVALGEMVRSVEGVESITPVMTMVNQSGATMEVLYGIEPESFNAVTGGFFFHSGRPFAAPDEVVVDNLFSQAREVEVGDEVELVSRKFRVAGIVEQGKGARVFMPLATAQEMNGRENHTSLFFLRLDDPDEVYAVVERLDEVFPTYPARVLRDYVSLMTSAAMPAMDAFLNTVVFVAVSIGVLVIFLSMYTTITERTREIGILRSLGASKRSIVALVLQESILICVLGVVLGLGLSVATGRLVTVFFPTLMVMFSGEWILKATLMAVLSGVIGSLYPSLKAASQDPVEAFAYE